MRANRIHLEVIDTKTGEIKVSGRVTRRDKKPRYFMNTHDGCRMLAKMKLSRNEYRVLLILQSKIGYKNLLFVNKTTLADEFACDRVMMSKTITMLEKREIINKVGTGYRISEKYIKCGE